MHRALELLFDLAPAARTAPAASELLERAYLELSAAEPESAILLRADLRLDERASSAEILAAVVSPSLPSLAGYFALEDPQRLEPHRREFGVNVEIADGFAIRGFIDRVDRTVDGEIRIVDYKSGRVPAPRFRDKPMFQMRFYALAWWRITGVVPKRLQLMYLSGSSILHFEPSIADLLATETQILGIRSAFSEAARSGTFIATTSKLCDWCSYRPLCPSWGGTTPPLPPPAEWDESSSLGGIAS